MTPAPSRLSANGEYGLPCDKCISDKVRVTVDGDMLRNIIAYDVIDGWVDVIAVDDSGKLIAHGDCWLVRRVHGDIRAMLL